MIRAWFCAVLLAAGEVDPPVFYAEHEALRAYLIEAGEKNPKLHALHEEWLAALERAPQSRALEDPMFRFQYMLQSDDRRYRVMLSQRFPWFGTLRVRGEQSELEAEAALQRFYGARNQLFAEVKQAYFDYAFLGESLRVTEELAEILRYAEETVRVRYSFGLGNQEDVLRIQTEQTQLQDRYDSLKLLGPAVGARLNATIGREGSDAPPWPDTLGLPPAPPPAPVALARMRVTNPELAEAQQLLESRRKGVELARKTRFPSVNFGIEFMDMKDPETPSRIGPYLGGIEAGRRVLLPPMFAGPEIPAGASDFEIGQAIGQALGSAPGQVRSDLIGRMMDLNELVELEEAFDNPKRSDEVMVMVELNLPIWRQKTNAAIRESKHLEAAAGHDRRSRAVALEAAARQALYEIEDGLRRIRVFDESLLPQAKQTYESVQSAYASGDSNADFLDLLQSVQSLLDFELERARALRDANAGAAMLEYLIGGPWTSDSGVEANVPPEADEIP